MATKVEKYAVVISSDADPKHVRNVEDSTRQLVNAGYQTLVFSPHIPSTAPTGHFQPNLAEIEKNLTNLASDADDEVVIYVTGHGHKEGGTASVCLQGGCVRWELETILNRINYGRRVVIMDQCYSGDWGKSFLNRLRTRFISLGNSGEIDFCQEWAPLFWSDDVPDYNGNKIIDWEERVIYAMEKGSISTFPQCIASEGYAQKGVTPFPTTVRNITTGKDFETEIGRLRPCQYAVVLFLAPFVCPPCDEYEPKFDMFAKTSGGQHLFLKVKNMEVAGEHGIDSYPSVVVIDSRGVRYRIAERENLLKEMTGFFVPVEERIAYFEKWLDSQDKSEKTRALRGIYSNSENIPKDKAARIAGMLRGIFDDDEVDLELRKLAISAYGGMASNLPDDEARLGLKTFSKLLGNSNLVASVVPSFNRVFREKGRLLSATEINEAAKRTRAFFNLKHWWLRQSSIEMYALLAGSRQLTNDEAREGAEALHDSMDPPFLTRLARWGDPPFADDRAFAVRAYSYLVVNYQLPKDEVDHGREIIDNLRHQPESHLSFSAVDAYYSAFVLRDDTFLKNVEDPNAAPSFRKLFIHESKDIRWRALTRWAILLDSKKLKAPEIALGAKAIREYLFREPNISLCCRAMDIYLKIARDYPLPDDELALALKTVESLSGNPIQGVSQSYWYWQRKLHVFLLQKVRE